MYGTFGLELSLCHLIWSHASQFSIYVSSEVSGDALWGRKRHSINIKPAVRELPMW